MSHNTSIEMSANIEGRESNGSRSMAVVIDKKCTVDDAWRMYQETTLAFSRKGTQRAAICSYGKYIDPLLRKKKIHELTQADYFQLRKSVEDTGVSPQTSKNILGLLRRVLYRYADLKKDCPPIPSFRRVMPKFDNKRLRYLTEDELHVILESMKRCDETLDWYNIVLFAVNTGMRRGEIFNLTLANVNFEDRTINVVDTKTYVNRIIPLNDITYKMLLEKRESLEKYDKIFKCHRVWRFERALDISGVNNGIDSRDTINRVVFHTFRHTFASWIVQDGVPLNVVSKLLGHQDIQMTMRYAHLAPSQTRNAVDMIASKMQNVIK